jgi:hypothetical protein
MGENADLLEEIVQGKGGGILRVVFVSISLYIHLFIVKYREKKKEIFLFKNYQ